MSDHPPGARPPRGDEATAEAEGPAAADPPAEERQATFRDVFAVREFRTLYLAGALSWVGDYLARAAITVLVYQQTSSVLLSAASFAVSYLPWIIGGPVLAALAERHPYRRVMIVCDLTRAALVALLLIPDLPVAAVLVVLFLATLANPPTQAAKSALIPLILTRDRLVVGLAVNSSTNQAAQVVGYLAGAAIAAAISPRVAIGVDVVTFTVSAVLIARGVQKRPPARSAAQRTHLLRETGEGFRIVFGNPILRWLAIMVFALTLFVIVPEGLAAAWAGQTTPEGHSRGLAQGLIMAASPVGFILGGLLIGRFVAPARRNQLIRPFAIAAPLVLVPALAAPSAPVVAAMALVSGFAVAGLMPTLNGMFVLALPHGFRARAFGVMQSGLQVTQGGAVLTTGVLAERFAVPTVVGAWSIGGTLLMTFVAIRWPRMEVFNNAIAAAGAQASAPPPPEPEVAEPARPVAGHPDAAADATRITAVRGYDMMSPPPAAGRMDR